MADFLFDKGREGFLDGSIDWDTGDIKAALVTADYTAVQASDEVLSDVVGSPSNYIVARSGNLATKTVAAGVADAEDVTISGVSGSQITQIVIYQDSGDDSTSRLIAHIDSYAGLPCTPNGGDIKISFPADANKIFKL